MGVLRLEAEVNPAILKLEADRQRLLVDFDLFCCYTTVVLDLLCMVIVAGFSDVSPLRTLCLFHMMELLHAFPASL